MQTDSKWIPYPSRLLEVLHHAHCSGVVEFPDGEVLIVYYHAIKEANCLQAIYGVRKLAGEDTFSEPFLVSKDKPTKMEGNPVLGQLLIRANYGYFMWKSFGGWAVCNPRYKISEDRGKTWSKFKRIYPFISRGMKNPPIITSKGWYLFGGYVKSRDSINVFYFKRSRQTLERYRCSNRNQARKCHRKEWNA